MYRHEAIAIARKMMEMHGVDEELKPWVVDAVLRAANSLSIEPFAWFNEPHNGVLIQRQRPSAGGYRAMCCSPQYVNDAQETIHRLSKARTPVAWRRSWIKYEGATPEFEFTTVATSADSLCWQPLYAD